MTSPRARSRARSTKSSAAGSPRYARAKPSAASISIWSAISSSRAIARARPTMRSASSGRPTRATPIAQPARLLARTSRSPRRSKLAERSRSIRSASASSPARCAAMAANPWTESAARSEPVCRWRLAVSDWTRRRSSNEMSPRMNPERARAVDNVAAMSGPLSCSTEASSRSTVRTASSSGVPAKAMAPAIQSIRLARYAWVPAASKWSHARRNRTRASGLRAAPQATSAAANAARPRARSSAVARSTSLARSTSRRADSRLRSSPKTSSEMLTTLAMARSTSSPRRSSSMSAGTWSRTGPWSSTSTSVGISLRRSGPSGRSAWARDSSPRAAW